MATRHAVIFFGILIVATVFWFIRPDANEPNSGSPAPLEPWMTSDVQHLALHGIRVGPANDADIHVTRAGDSLKVEIRSSFLQKQEAGFLTTVGMLNPAETMSEERFAEFIEAIHLTVLTEDEKAGHMHEHQEGETDPHQSHEDHPGGHNSPNQ